MKLAGFPPMGIEEKAVECINSQQYLLKSVLFSPRQLKLLKRTGTYSSGDPSSLNCQASFLGHLQKRLEIYTVVMNQTKVLADANL